MLLLGLHAAVTLLLVGLIWTVQLAIYPLFAAIGQTSMAAYHESYKRRITALVGPLMAAEIVTGVLLFEHAPQAVPLAAVALGMALIGVNAASTAWIQVPLHEDVVRDHNRARVRLARSNWLRTLTWTARGALVLWMCALAAGDLV